MAKNMITSVLVCSSSKWKHFLLYEGGLDGYTFVFTTKETQILSRKLLIISKSNNSARHEEELWTAHIYRRPLLILSHYYSVTIICSRY